MNEKPMEGDVIIKANTRAWCIFALTEDGEIESLAQLTNSVLREDINISALERQMNALTAERDAALARAERERDAYIECQRRVQDAWDQARWAKATTAVLRQSLIEAQQILDTEGIRSDHIDELLAEHQSGADLLAELARLRKLEVWAQKFVAEAPASDPRGDENDDGFSDASWRYYDDNEVDFGFVLARWLMANELRALLESEQAI